MNDAPILQRLAAGEILVCDGATGTELQKRGLPTGGCPEEYNLTHPEVIRSIMTDYYRAGSVVVETNTFGCNRYRLKRHRLESRAEEFSLASARLAAEARACVYPEPEAAGRYFISGSIGPTGEMLEPLGQAREDDVLEAFAEEVRALVRGGVDLLQVETMMAIDEAVLAVRAAKTHSALPVAATMTFTRHGQQIATMWGVTVDEAVGKLTEAGADILGANCGNGFDEMTEIIRAMRPLTAKPILAKANAGMPEVVDGRAVYKQTPEAIREKVEELLDLGVNMIGGCCGTGPDHIRVIAEIVKTRQS